jgi:hypothetical protein
MSSTQSQQTEVHPDESISQVNISDEINEDGEEIDGYLEHRSIPNNVPDGTGLDLPKIRLGYFKVTAETLDEGRKFLKVPASASILSKKGTVAWV